MAAPNNGTGPPFVPVPVQNVVSTTSPPGPNLAPKTLVTSISTTSQPPSTTVTASGANSGNSANVASTTVTPSGPGAAVTTITPSSAVNFVTTIAASGTTTNSNGTPEPATVVITSTESGQRFPSGTVTQIASSSSSSSSKSGSAALATSGASASSTSGLSPGGTIAVAVVVPVVAVALIVLAALFLWRRRKQRKDAEELRRKEVEEYGFNPNNDPTLPVVASTNGDDPSEMTQTDGAGYRGWGTTSTARKPSTTLSSGNRPVGVARSTSNSDNGRYTNGSPTAGTNQSSGVESNDPLVGSPPKNRPMTGDSETIGALGAVPANGNPQNINRGPSNASSAYSGAHRSDTSGEGMMPGGASGQQYYNEGMYYDEGMPQHGPYGDGSYGGGQPVVQDVPARRNTRIENPSVIPQQGSSGIAQNF